MQFSVLLLLVLLLVLFTSGALSAKKAPKAAKVAKQQVVNGTSTTAKTDKETAARASPAVPTAQTPPEAPPTVDWGKCPQLEPKDADKLAKAAVLESCLKAHPIPKNLTEESIEKHQRSIAECALKKENWFTKSGSYRFSKAESEIKTKGLAKPMETELKKHHKKCESEAKKEFPQKTKVVEQIQLYQACMDFHITETCQITLKPAAQVAPAPAPAPVAGKPK